MDNTKAKKLLKIALAIYIVSFFVINWADVSWMFNYREVYGLVSDFFNPFPSINASAVDKYFYPNHSEETAQKFVQNVATTYTDKQNVLEIPSISLSTPIVFATTTDKSILMKNLDQGVVYYPGSVYPGQVGQIVVLGHSAPPGWPKIKHDWVFTNLQKLKEGDEVLINLNNKQYTYIVQKTTIIQRGADVPATEFDGKNNVITLISCWPPGKDYQRIAVQAVLKTK